jgi:3-isopropylmalate dehydrogenase
MPPSELTSRKAKRIAVIPGDGVGSEVIPEAVRALRAAVAEEFEHVEFDWGAERFLRDGTTLPAGAVEMLRDKFDAILFGALGDPRIPSHRHAEDILLGLRKKLDLYVNFRPVELLDRSLTPLRNRSEQDVRFVIFRENLEGLYAGAGGQFRRGTPEEIAIEEDVNTRRGVERIIRYAFAYAREHGLGRVLMSDKSNVMIHGHELWGRVFAIVREEYPEIEARHAYVDALAAALVREPHEFRVIVTCNAFGDILSDLGAQLAGGLGLAPSGNIHPGRVSLFEPVHGSAPDIAGKGVANPMASVLAAAMLCDHIGWPEAGGRLRAAVRAAIREGQTTADLGGDKATREVGAWIADYVGRARDASR